MSLIFALILGVVQGVTEFLPISSSGHLILAQKLLGLTPDLFTATALHLGTLAAVVVFYRKQLKEIIRRPFCKKTALIVISALPTAAMGLAAKVFLPSWLDGAILPIGFALTFVLLLTCDLFSPKPQFDLLTLKPRKALVAGIAQGISVLPGLSRSGATVCALKMMGVKNEAAVEMSFLMSVPVILGSVLLSLPDMPQLASVNWLAFLLGMAASAVTGYFSLGFLKKMTAGGNLSRFALYAALPLLLSCVIF